MLLSEHYRGQLEQLHGQVMPNGGTWGATACKRIYDLIPWICREGEPKTLLDYGSADGKFQFQARRRGLLENTEIIEYDPGFPEKCENNIPCEVVMCIDVLEHIEPDCLDDVLKDLKRCIQKFGVFDIALFEANQTLPDGRNAHLIVESPVWWKNKLSEHFEIIHTKLNNVRGGFLRVHVEPNYGN